MELNNPFSLQGKRILVTGATSGIGRQTAIECSKMGASVVATGRNEERLNETLALLATPGEGIIADLTQTEDLTSLASNVGKVDGVVLCAGVGVIMPVKFATPEKITNLFQINFFSQVELLRLLQKKKSINNGGSVVAISSIGGPYAINFGNGPYGASKSALLTWMKFVAQEFAARQIRVNCICPGMIHTPLVDNQGMYSQEDLSAYTDSILLKRFGEPQDVAYGAIYLLSDAAKWVTGTELIVDGGTTLR